MTTPLGVHSEVGKLRKVIVHRPGAQPEAADPDNHDELLFDDVLWVERAQREHDQFVARMRERGVEVFYVQDLLGEALAASEEARQRLIELVASEYVVGPSLVEEVRRGLSTAARRLARHLIGGLTVGESGLDLAGSKASLIGAAIDDEAVRPAAAAEHAVHPRLVVLDLRRRLDQPDVLARPAPRGLQHAAIYRAHPMFAGRRLRVLVSAAGRRRAVQGRGLRPRVAGGRRRRDHRQGTVAIGMSERTTGRMIERIAKRSSPRARPSG